MFKKLTCLIIFFAGLFVWAQVSVMSVTDEDKHTSKEDFYHTFEYYVSSPGQKTAKCQATRINKRWFATAAHCVQSLCKKQCTLQIDLLEYNTSAIAIVEHPAKNERSAKKTPTVFIHPGFSMEVFAKDDLALIRADLRHTPLIYYTRSTNPNSPHQGISKEAFEAFLEKNRRAKSKYNRVMKPSFPPILVFDEGNYLLDRKLSVISIFDGKREVKLNPNPVYYLKALGYAFTNNFGIRKGMSGSGVMTNTGELAGIISANMDLWYKQGNQKKQELNYFVFPVFNTSLVSFMRDTMGSDFDQVEQKDAYPYAVSKTRKDFSALIPVLKSFSK